VIEDQTVVKDRESEEQGPALQLNFQLRVVRAAFTCGLCRSTSGLSNRRPCSAARSMALSVPAKHPLRDRAVRRLNISEPTVSQRRDVKHLCHSKSR
jgi:hypothetical protein